MRQTTNDLLLAAGLLTRFPLPSWELDGTRTATAAWAWPLIGACLGALGAAVGGIALWAGLPPLVAAALAMIAMAMATGGLHEDGLADTADGLWGGMTLARRLEIMRDSRVGAYGVLALVLMMGLRLAVIAALADTGNLGLLVAAGALSRFGMGAMMAALPPARLDGLSKGTGQPPRASVAVALAVAALASIVAGLPLISWIAAASVLIWLGWQARSKLGGQTGDILGAGCLLAETAALIAAL